jgi:RNA polymerase sigma factor (sigma-70 family)
LILVDSSVWIDLFRGNANAQSRRLEALLGSEPLLTGDLILTEVLRGFARDQDFQRARIRFAALPCIQIGGEAIALQAARNCRNLRARGISVRGTIDALYREESRRVLATLIRLLGDFDLAEEALHDAFRAAIEQWPTEGVPDNPRAWLVTTGRFKGIDRMRKRRRLDVLDAEHAEQIPAETEDLIAMLDTDVEDDRLRLIFTCCHPALPADARVALTLREVCGLTTEEIARAFLTAPSTLAQRIVRAKNKIKVAGIPYVVPSRSNVSAIPSVSCCSSRSPSAS